MIELIDSYKLDTWIKKNRNVLFIGEHGVGKTSAVIAAFERAKLKWLYFSAATCDPFIDFIGVPRVVEENGKSVLKLIRQSYLEDDSVEAIFIDEYNRGKKTMKNAVMELIQFKSVNGRKYPNLKVVWAAANPPVSPNDYDVEPMDPAQEDRFHIKLYVDYKPCPVYMEKHYGEEVTSAALEWWKGLEKTPQHLPSPRRLCYALDWWLDGEDIREILTDTKSNASRLLELLESKPIDLLLKELYENKNDVHTIAFINVENNLMRSIDIIKENPVYLDYFLSHMYNERLSSLMTDDKIFEYVITNLYKHANFQSMCQSILTVNKDDVDSNSVANKLKSEYVKRGMYSDMIDPIVFKGVNKNAECYVMENVNPLKNNIITIRSTYPNITDATQAHRDKIWNMILKNVPADMELDDAQKLAVLINETTFQQQGRTKPWLKYKDYLGVVNQVCKCMFSHGMLSKDIRDIMPGVFFELAYERDDECFIHPRI